MNGKTAVITGGASGIGLACGKRLMSEGCNVVLLDVNEKVESIAKDNGCMGMICDVSNEEDVKHCIDEVIKKYNHIDYLVANAGIGGSASLPHEVSLEEWNKVIGVNQTGIFLMNKYVISEMLKTGGGSIVNTSSMYGLVGTNMSFAYSASKGAINQITRSLALSYARENIRVNAIAPGFFVTKQNQALLYNEDGTPTARTNKILNATPMGRFGEVNELVGATLFLIDNKAASFITGICVPIDGGFSSYSGV